jgi:hypothetical protein
MRVLFPFVIVLLVSIQTQSILCQEEVAIIGHIYDEKGRPIAMANIVAEGNSLGTVTDQAGNYILRFPAPGLYTLRFSCLGYSTETDTIKLNATGTKEINKVLYVSIKKIDEVFINGNIERTSNLTRIDTKALALLPNTSGNIETLLKTMPGVSSNNELSSQYSVRGGNFDENLVYVNDIEIYRPFLIRSGQQEGLSFINPDLVSGIRFSAGGFDASYGDKMSSVLDVSYKRPVEFGGSVAASLLGGSLHLEGVSKNGRFSHISGVRYKSNQYLLNSLDTRGEYKPTFADFQTNMNFRISSKLDLNFLGNFAMNQYAFIPVSRETDFGTIKQNFRLKIYYDGNELDRYKTWMGAFTLHYHPSEKISLKIIGSSFSSNEMETYDIQGQYLINELDNTIGSKTAGDSIRNIGVGTFLDHARNFFDVNVYSVSHIGNYFGEFLKIRWGLKYQEEIIDDRLNEWKMIDSAGYSLPYTGSTVNLTEATNSTNNPRSRRYTGFLQGTYTLPVREEEIMITAGVRTHYWDYNEQLLINPRIALAFSPSSNPNLLFRLATGLYDQPPFYKELRDRNGILNHQLKAQKSVHYVAGGDYFFNAWERPFKFTTEIYYKNYWDLIPYKIDNVRVRYSARNQAVGYSTGIDFKINGEFVKNAESWASLSFMRTREDIQGDSYLNADSALIYPGYYPRPTDQLINFGLYFQDYLPSNPSYRVSLYFLYGGRLPFSSPLTDRYDQVYRMPAYKRVDIGFIKVIKEEGVVMNENRIFKPFKGVLLSAEIFNLLGNNNTISYLWVKTVSNLEGVPGLFAVPNFLTSRRLNIRISFRF